MFTENKMPARKPRALTLASSLFLLAVLALPSLAQQNDGSNASGHPGSAGPEAPRKQVIETVKENPMMTKATIEGYFDALKQKKGWDSFLAEDMTFTSLTSPVKRVSGKAAYLEATKRFYGGIVTFELRDLMIDGDRACALTRYQLQPPNLPAFESNVAEIFHVREGKIVSFDIYFDTAPFPK